ncbi:hypothetical protein AB0J21_02870 [Streptomyces sp. NPDC049954]|uniref:hypothetical protein n=1 Tax=Streptomyces sp. NPDC049954 TaxID=3155779 RepID=UPI00344563D9
MIHSALAATVPCPDWVFLFVALLATAVACVVVPLRIEMSRTHAAPPDTAARPGAPEA